MHEEGQWRSTGREDRVYPGLKLHACGDIYRPIPFYGRGTIDPDAAKKRLQVEFTVEDEGVFTTPWSGRVTYRRLIGDWPEAVCAENPFFLGSDATIPTAHAPDF